MDEQERMLAALAEESKRLDERMAARLGAEALGAYIAPGLIYMRGGDVQMYREGSRRPTTAMNILSHFGVRTIPIADDPVGAALTKIHQAIDAL